MKPGYGTKYLLTGSFLHEDCRIYGLYLVYRGIGLAVNFFKDLLYPVIGLRTLLDFIDYFLWIPPIMK